MVLGTALDSGASGQPLPANVSGVYRITDTRSTSSCSPEELPSSALGDSTRYIRLGSALGSRSSLLDIEQSGGILSVTPVDSNQHLAGGAPIHGTVAGTVGSLVVVISLRMEGPRRGGHRFAVLEKGGGTIRFGSVITTPTRRDQRAGATGMFLHLVESDTFYFRERNVSGPVFTTCVVASTVAASRTSLRLIGK